MSKPLAITAVTVAALLGLAACSSDSKDSKSTDNSTSTTKGAAKAPVTLNGTVNNKGTKDISTKGASTEIEVELDDFYFEPTFIKVAPGQKIKVELENEGSMAHTFTSSALGVDQEVAPGKKATVNVTIPTTGATPFFCRFHQSSGMQGAMFITAS
jgi:plastocyanin